MVSSLPFPGPRPTKTPFFFFNISDGGTSLSIKKVTNFSASRVPALMLTLLPCAHTKRESSLLSGIFVVAPVPLTYIQRIMIVRLGHVEDSGCIHLFARFSSRCNGWHGPVCFWRREDLFHVVHPAAARVCDVVAVAIIHMTN